MPLELDQSAQPTAPESLTGSAGFGCHQQMPLTSHSATAGPARGFRREEQQVR